MDIVGLTQLQNLPSDAIFGIISDSSKEFYISYTSNMKGRIAQILTSGDVELKEDSRVVIFDKTFKDLEYKQLFTEKYKGEYINKGYKNVCKDRVHIQYKVRVVYSKELRSVYVYLVNKRKDHKLVGVFDSMDEASLFVKECYEGQDMVQPVYKLHANSNRKEKS